MTKFTQKLDRRLLKLFTLMLVPRVKKTKGRQNKFHCYIKVLLRSSVVLAVCFLGISPLAWRLDNAPIVYVSIMMLLWGVMIISEIYDAKHFEEIALLYHIAVFMNKDSKQIKIFKEGIEAQFKLFQKNRMKFVYMVLAWFCFCVLIEVPIVATEGIQLSTLAHSGIFYLQYRFLLGKYIFYIDDITPPKRRKRAKQSITDMAKKAWENLIKSPLPSPSPA